MESATPSIGLAVGHLFWKPNPMVDREATLAALEQASEGEDQLITVSMLGHKADLATMLLTKDQWRIRSLQTALTAAGWECVDSYMSLTETSEYSAGMPEEMQNARLYPTLPPEGKQAYCFYPMSKRRGETENWFTLEFEERKALMHEHGTSGRKFAGKVVQLISGSTGLDDFEWGVTLFCVSPDVVKEVVYTMRFDVASAKYAEFGTFYIGMVATPTEALDSLGIGAENVE
ncbi:MAG TPA: chlorite dismutase [Acidimicrobiaceae bacterium]|jgi:peroxiredoxin|nr:chlorite dismutase [Acidimicrobiaceae bacterium]